MNQQLKSAILGATQKAAATGNHRPDPKRLKAVLAAGAFMPTFCAGCGFVQGFSKNRARALAETFGLKPAEVATDRYFISRRCTLCADSFKEVTTAGLE